MRETIFQIHDLRHTFKEKKVLEIPRLSFEKGKIYALVGPNGSGKTTFLKILSLLLPPTSGSLFFCGENPWGSTRLQTLRQSIILVLQDPLLFNTTVFKNVAYGLKVRKISREERGERVRKALQMVGLAGFEGRRVKELSGGEAQRVTVAQALAIDLEVLLLDEPTANIDEKNVEILEEIIRRLNRENGTTIIFTTHHMDQAYRLADEVIPLFEGHIVQSPVENLFHGRVVKSNDLSLFDTGKILISISRPEKEAKYISIPPQDILLSLVPLSSSARNSYLGKIISLQENKGAVDVTVQAGEEFKVRITKDSFREMGLNLGHQVYLTFKSTAVKVF